MYFHVTYYFQLFSDHRLCGLLKRRLNSFAPGIYDINSKNNISKLITQTNSLVFLVKLLSDECDIDQLIGIQHCFRQYTITWAKVDPVLCYNMASLVLVGTQLATPVILSVFYLHQPVYIVRHHLGIVIRINTDIATYRSVSVRKTHWSYVFLALTH